MAMSRPEKLGQVKDRYNSVGTFYLDEMITDPALMKCYTAFCEAVKKAGGRVRKEYNTTIRLDLLKNSEQMQAQLEYDQRRWDQMDAEYHVAFNRAPGELGAKSEWEKERVQEWAKNEGRPDPWGIALHDDPELDELRESLGMDKDE